MRNEEQIPKQWKKKLAFKIGQGFLTSLNVYLSNE